MEGIIKELQSQFERLENQEKNEIYDLVLEEVWDMTSGEINRRVKEKEQLGENDAKKIADDITNDLERNHLEKFIGLTDEVKDEIEKRCTEKVRSENEERTYTIYLLTWLIEYLNLEESKTFLELEKLVEIFQLINLRINSQIAIFSYIIRINHKLGNNSGEPSFHPDINAMLNFEYKHMDVGELRTIFKEQRFGEFMDSKSLKYLKARKEIEKRYEETKLDFTSRQQACNILDDIFQKKAINITEEDYQTIVEKMDEIFFGHLAYRIIKILKKNNSSNKNLYELLEEKKENVESINTKVEEKSKSQDEEKKEYKSKKKSEAPKKQTSLNQTIREINKYFDLDNLELKEELSLDQIIYVLSLMFSINIEENIIESFLRSTMREFKNFHPYAIYNQAYDKFVYLGNDNLEVKDHLDMIEYILNEVNIFMCDEEKYASTKELIEEEINELMRVINGNYTYEIEEAKKLLKDSKRIGE